MVPAGNKAKRLSSANHTTETIHHHHHHHHHQPNDNDIIESESLKFKSKFIDNTNGEGTVNAKVALPLKYYANFWRTLEMFLINCEINLILIWSANCIISEGNRRTTFLIIDTKLYVPVVTLSTQDNTKLLQQLKSGFRRTTNWNKYQSK